MVKIYLVLVVVFVPLMFVRMFFSHPIDDIARNIEQTLSILFLGVNGSDLVVMLLPVAVVLAILGQKSALEGGAQTDSVKRKEGIKFLILAVICFVIFFLASSFFLMLGAILASPLLILGMVSAVVGLYRLVF